LTNTATDDNLIKLNYCKTRRFFPTKEYEAGSKIVSKKEIVSFDCGLCGKFYYKVSEPGTLLKIPLNTDEQILVFFENPHESYENRNMEGFEFCGYDLCEVNISAITNCSGMFDDVIPVSELNIFGLLDDCESAYQIRELLKMKYPYENHADCEVYELWRRI
jgi:hypothetical protein